jgi:hypothetical protein
MLANENTVLYLKSEFGIEKNRPIRNAALTRKKGTNELISKIHQPAS